MKILVVELSSGRQVRLNEEEQRIFENAMKYALPTVAVREGSREIVISIGQIATRWFEEEGTAEPVAGHQETKGSLRRLARKILGR